eukprot:g19259.t1
MRSLRLLLALVWAPLLRAEVATHVEQSRVDQETLDAMMREIEQDEGLQALSEEVPRVLCGSENRRPWKHQVGSALRCGQRLHCHLIEAFITRARHKGRFAGLRPPARASPGPPPRCQCQVMRSRMLRRRSSAYGAAVPSAPSWKRLERTVTQYVSRRNVTLSEYEQVQQRYEGHMNTLKVLCETVRAPEKEKKIIHRGSRGLNFRDLQEEKDRLTRNATGW